MKRLTLLALVVTAIVGSPVLVGAHCQIPCGIYDDELRVQLIEEHIGTVEKAMQQIIALGKDQPANINQLVRWVDNKEQHAQEIQDIVTAYFMAQRIKPMAENTDGRASYVEQLTLLHDIQIRAMKAKQSTDLAQVEALRALVVQFRKAYFGEPGTHAH
jgi:nickel superoxide dismutase